MNKKKLAIIGAGGHSKVVADCAQLMEQWTTVSFHDDKVPNNRPLSELDTASPEQTDIFVAIGNNQTRQTVTHQFQKRGFHIPLIRHPTSVVAQESTIGNGTVLMAGAIVNPGTTIGQGCILNTGSSVDHDCNLGNFIHISPGARLAGTVTVKDRAWVGIGAAVRQNITIGSDVMIAAGAAVINDIEDHKVVKGVPAK